ncbi:MAG: PDZ domain-containing protein [Planctomycetota bacterium]
MSSRLCDSRIKTLLTGLALVLSSLSMAFADPTQAATQSNDRLQTGPTISDDRVQTGPTVAPPPGELREEVRQMIAGARDRVFPALVNIDVITVQYWGGKERKGGSTGSGTIISPEGYIVTNQHVTDNGKKFKVRLADKQEINAEMVGEDPLTDLAVLKLNLAELARGTELPVAHFGDSEKLQIGDYVMSMGSPFALSRSVTLGIVSNTDRVFGGEFGGDDLEEMELEWGQRTGLFTRWIQHDAAINPGNSGGPLVNLNGEIVGVNELGQSSIGFAIPSNLAKRVVAELIAHGEVPRSYIGVSFKSIKKTGLDAGVLINSVVADGPAERAGLQAGDVVLSIDGTAVTVRYPEEVPPLLKQIATLPIGGSIRFQVQRDGQPLADEITVTTEVLQKDKGDEAALRAWGLTVMEITEKMARERRLDNTAGVLMSSVRSGGPAQLAEPPIHYGDVLRAIDGQPVTDLPTLIRRYQQTMEREPLPEFLLIEFDRRGKNHVTLLKPKPDEMEDPPREVRKSWIGIATQPVLRKLAEKLGYPDIQGYRITRVYPRTLAASGDLLVGDVILKLNGEPLRLRGMQDAGQLSRLVRRLEIGELATLTLLRDGQELDVKVELEPTRLSPEEARRDRNEDFELTVRELTFFDRDENRWDEDVRGVLVEQVEGAGWAGLGGINAGDLIQRIQDQPIQGLKSYRRVMKNIAKEQPERLVMVVLRGVKTHFQYIEPDWKPTADDNDGDKE